MDKYRVRCGDHHYDTLFNLSLGTAIEAARMHALTGCNQVEVIDPKGNKIDWRNPTYEKK